MQNNNSIVRQAFSPSLVEGVLVELAALGFEGETSGLSTEVEARADLKLLRKTVDSILPHLSSDTRIGVSDELAEIIEDLHWSKSEQGKAVVEINNWSQSFRGEWRSDPRFDNMCIGTHSELHVILVTGRAKTKKDLDDAIKLIETHNPPRKLLIKVVTE